MLKHFQCAKCHFRNIQVSDPDSLEEEDMGLMVVIRRSTLDVLGVVRQV